MLKALAGIFLLTDIFMRLIDTLIPMLQEKGDIPFVEFMQEALYHPHFGYYSAGLQKFGAAGDFITAPELTPLFGYALANQCQEVLNGLNKPIMFEFGAGSGQLCIDVLTRLETLNALPYEYRILEVSANLRHRQMTAIQNALPHLAERVTWCSGWPEAPFEGVVIANEVLDAMPVNRFLQTNAGLLESYIGLTKEGALCERFKPCMNERLIAYVERIIAHDLCPYQSEANLFVAGWLKQCAAMLERGAFFIMDYGFPRHEYYHPDRHMGTLMCHHRHQAHTNFLAHPGEEDITAHVDFTQVAEAAVDAGFAVAGFTNQGSFLLANGILSLLAEVSDERRALNQKTAVKQLLQESEMGELFKVMALTKKMDGPFTGFQLHDRRFGL